MAPSGSVTPDHALVERFGVPAAKAKKMNARTVKARVFLDCSCGGDVMAKAGVTYTYGRESRDEYRESPSRMLPMILTGSASVCFRQETDAHCRVCRSE